MHEHLAWDIKLVYRTYATYNSSDKIGLDIYFNFWKRALIWWNVFICNYACLGEIHAETTVEYVSALHSAHCTQSAYVCASGVPSMETCDRSDHGICHAVHSSFQIKSSFEFCVVSGVSGTMHSNEWMPAYFLPHSVLCNQWTHIHCQLEYGSCWFCVSLHFISFCWSDYPFCCHSMCFICAMMTIEQQQFPGLMKRGYIFKSQMDIFWTKIAKIKLLSETILQCIQSDPAHQMPGWIFVWVGFGYAKYSTILFSLINQIYYGNLVTQWNGFIRYFVVFIFAHPTNMLHLMIIHFISLNLIKLFFVLWLSSNNDI